MEADTLEADVLADEVLELVGRNLTETLESGDLGIGAEVGDSLLALLLGVAVASDEVALAVGVVLLLVALDEAFPVAHTEERRLQDVYVALFDEVGEELQEEGNHQQADVHAVDIGIGGHDDLVVTEPLEAILDVERGLQEVKLLVLVNHLLGEAERIERLTTQAEHGLCVHVATLGDGSAR